MCTISCLLNFHLFRDCFTDVDITPCTFNTIQSSPDMDIWFKSLLATNFNPIISFSKSVCPKKYVSCSSDSSIKSVGHMSNNFPGNPDIFSIKNMAQEILGQRAQIIATNKSNISCISSITSTS
jgi:hypothetical protein